MKTKIFYFALGAILFSGITAFAINIVGEDVSYDNTNSGLTSTNVQDAVDELTNLAASNKIDLLWTNPSPTSAFAAQTVAVDLSDYDAILLQQIAATADYNANLNSISMVRLIQYVPKGASVSQLSYGSYTNGSGRHAVRYYRDITVADSSVTFGGGYYTSGTSTANDNGFAIPIRIWGLKGTLPETNN